jgi:hypothetical protein
MDLGEVGWRDVDWIGLAQDRNRWRALVNSVLNLRVPLLQANATTVSIPTTFKSVINEPTLYYYYYYYYLLLWLSGLENRKYGRRDPLC